MLEDLLKKLDKSEQYIDEYSIEEEFINVLRELEKTDKQDEIILARLNYQFVVFVTNFERGVLGRFSDKDKEGNVYEYPDINSYGSLEFEYLKKRFDETCNPYLKGKYGLLLLLSKNENAKPYKTNQIAAQTCQALLKLSKLYWDNIKKDSSFDTYLFNAADNCIRLAYQRKFNECLDQIRDFIISTTLNLEHADILLLDFLRIINNHLKHFLPHKDLGKIIEYSMDLCKTSDNSDSYLITEIGLVALELSQELKLDETEWLKLLANQYESMAEEGRKNNRTDVSYHLENALVYYKKLNNAKKVGEIELEIEESKKDIDLSTIGTEIPEEYLKKIKERNQRLLQEGTDTILHFLTSTIYIPPISAIKEIAMETYGKSVINLFPIAPIDKFGNTLGSFTNDESKAEYNTAQVYNNELQIALITIAEVFSTAVKDGKLSSEIFMDHLKKGWIGQIKTVRYAHGIVEIDLTKLLHPSIKLIFDELTKSANGVEISIDNVVLAIDSITTKMEYLLRFLGSILNIPSFKYVRDGYQEQKNIYDYFREQRIIESFSEDDLYYLKHVLTEKVTGINLRGMVAHGLLDYYEYNIAQTMLLLIALLKIGQFVAGTKP